MLQDGMVLLVKVVDRSIRGRALPHFTPLTAPGFCGVSRKSNHVSMRGMGGFPWSIEVARFGLREILAGASPALPLAVMFPTITERNLRSRGQTFHSVTGALTALWPVSDKRITGLVGITCPDRSKFSQRSARIVACVSFPRCGCRTDVNSRQK